MSRGSMDSLPQSWITWFPAVKEEKLRRYYQDWQRLNERCLAMARVLDQTRLLPEANRLLELAAKKLDYEVPYRIVVLGESGAGKSTLINALLGQNRLATGAGGAVTGVPIYVHPLGPNDEERVDVTYRTAQEFSRLLSRIAARYGISLPDDYDVGDQWAREVITSSSKVSSDRQLQLIEDIQDIVATWRRLENRGDLGKIQSFDPDADHDYLQDLMEERSERNKPGSSERLIAGIARIDYYLRILNIEGDSIPQTNVVFIDTPGIGARTVRHQEILLEEVEQADAVILVVNARRPEDKTASLAYLLNQALLGNFTPEQKSHFAQKVFLVVNQVDAIQDVADRRRLEDSVRELCKIIDPSFWARHVAQETDRRYFETIAQLAVYAQVLNSGKRLDSLAESRYRGYLEQLLSDRERQSADCHVKALEKSQIPLLRSKLTEFLGERRLHLMLEEAEAILQQVVPTASAESRTFFERNGLVVDESLSAEVITDRNVRQLCKQQLKRDRDELSKQYEQMWDAMQRWRGSDAYKKSLTAQIEEICRDIERRVRDWLYKALADPNLVRKSMDAVSGSKIREMPSMGFLLEAERELRHILEEEGRNLAAYYLREFREFIHTYRIHDAIQEKSYDQPYMRARLASITSLEDIEEEIEREFTDICRWVPVYELMRDPLVAMRDRSGEIIPKIAAEVSEQILDIALISLDIAGPPQISAAIQASRLFSRIRDVRRRQLEEQKKSGAESAIEQEMDNKLKRLRSEIDEAVLKWDLDRIRGLIVKELTVRSRKALGQSLPYLDMLFFYQLEKHQQVFNRIADTIYREHDNQVSDGNESIRQIIVRQNKATLVEAMELIKVVEELRAVA